MQSYSARRGGSARPGAGLLLALALLVAACGQGAGPHGTITGDVVAGPTCPVERPENPCPPKPVPDRRVDIQARDGATVASTTTDANGHFSVDVSPGAYVVHVTAGPGMLGIRQSTPGYVTVEAGKTDYIKIELDTGIR